MDAALKPFLTIVGMALATYSTRALGPALAARLPMGGRVEAFLKGLPGAILVALVAPTVFTAGPAEALASAVTLAVAFRFGGLVPALAAGLGSVLLFRWLLG
ncbi:putative membrane protein [Desulfocurvibacter africanus PCS]|uniref:Putative membrane protein n=1 Tax=Desulfocurvibacter africanus PCS TaxID=1262666 RepID=M5PPD3_DESAF|nr:AzlD domain-containing protein [Desulfocurvibacter africanus]EMG35790.1 putative membrane protein [Desulfocurvibacter africanus PCS]